MDAGYDPWDEVDTDELMSEPPGGGNHGWRKTRDQRYFSDTETWGAIWVPLGQEEERVPSPALSPPADHGTLTKYFTRGCRCELCRKKAREWKQQQRGKRVERKPI